TRPLELEGFQDGRHLLRLGLCERQLIHDDSFLVLKFAQDGHAGRGPNGFLRQMVLVIAGLRALGRAAALALVGPPRARPGVAGALLAEQLLGAAGDLAATQSRMRTSPLVGEIHQHDIMEKLLVDLATELLWVHLHGTYRFAVSIEDA